MTDQSRYVQLKVTDTFNYKLEGETRTFEEGERFSASRRLATLFINNIGKVAKTGKEHVVEDPESDLIKPETDKERTAEGFLEERTVAEVEDDLDRFDDPEGFLADLHEEADRVGVEDAVEDRIDELTE